MRARHIIIERSPQTGNLIVSGVEPRQYIGFTRKAAVRAYMDEFEAHLKYNHKSNRRVQR